MAVAVADRRGLRPRVRRPAPSRGKLLAGRASRRRWSPGRSSGAACCWPPSRRSVSCSSLPRADRLPRQHVAPAAGRSTPCARSGAPPRAVGEQARVQTAPAPPVIRSSSPRSRRSGRRCSRATPSRSARAARCSRSSRRRRSSSSSTPSSKTTSGRCTGSLFLVAALAVLFADSLRRMQGWGPVWNGPGRSDRLVPGAGRNARVVVAAVLAVAVVDAVPRPRVRRPGPDRPLDVGGEGAVTVSALVSMAAQLNAGEPQRRVRGPDGRPLVLADDRARPVRRRDLDAEGELHHRGRRRDPAPRGRPVAGADESTQIVHVRDGPDLPVAPDHVPTDVAHDPGRGVVGSGERDREDRRAARSGRQLHGPSRFVAPAPRSSDSVDVGRTRPALHPPPGGHAARRSATLALDGPPTPRTLREGHGDPGPPDVRRTSSIRRTWRTARTSARSWSSSGYQEGFCQQFATAMAVLLRSIGIPARVAVGFTAGDPIADGYRVQTDDYHAWVEVPFAGVRVAPVRAHARGRTNPIARRTTTR